MATQLADFRNRLDFGNADSIQEFGASLNSLFENSNSRQKDAAGGAVAASDSTQKEHQWPLDWKLQPSETPPFARFFDPTRSRAQEPEWIEPSKTPINDTSPIVWRRIPGTSMSGVVEKPQRGRLLRWLNTATAFFDLGFGPGGVPTGIVDRYESWRATRAAKTVEFNGQTFPVVAFPENENESALEKLIATAKVSIEFPEGGAVGPELRKALDQAEARGVVVRFNPKNKLAPGSTFVIFDGKMALTKSRNASNPDPANQSFSLTSDPKRIREFRAEIEAAGKEKTGAD